MTPGIILIVVGAMLTFAVTDHVPNVDLGTAGWILMVAGLAVLAYNIVAEFTRKNVVRREEWSDPDDQHHVVRQILEQRRMD